MGGLRVAGMACLMVLAAASAARAFGALAIDSNRGDRSGVATDQDSIEAASAAALAQCGTGCKVVVIFDLTCAVFVVDRTKGSTLYSFGYAPTTRRAAKPAMDYCRNSGGKSCRLRVEACEREPAEDNTAWARATDQALEKR